MPRGAAVRLQPEFSMQSGWIHKEKYKAPLTGANLQLHGGATHFQPNLSRRINGATIPLTPGMTAAVDIKTENRRVIDYLLSPLAKTMSEAMAKRKRRAPHFNSAARERMVPPPRLERGTSRSTI